MNTTPRCGGASPFGAIVGFFLVGTGFGLEAELMPVSAQTPEEVRTTPAPTSAMLAEIWKLAEERNTTGLVVMHEGRLLAEWHRPSGRANAAGHALEDVASVQKSVTALLVGIAQEKDLLRLGDPVHRWLGVGWSRAPQEAEAVITLRHLLTMTSGLKDDLSIEAPVGTRWRYNTPAYARLLEVLPRAAGMKLEALTAAWLTGPLGMADSRWERRTGASVAVNPWGFVTTARDLATLGQMVLLRGQSSQGVVLSDRGYWGQMLSASQRLNEDYGYLWWLNSSANPGREGRRIAAAPADLVAAQGAGDCLLYVLPSRQLVIARVGQSAGRDFAGRLWTLLDPMQPSEAEAPAGK